MNLIRSLVLLAIGWTVLALGAGALGVWTDSPPAVSFFLPQPSLQQAVTIGTFGSKISEKVVLVDRVTGESKRMPLPTDEVWALLTVCPWRDQNGNIEVVGRWARHFDPPGDRPFSGLGLFKLPGATVVTRLPLDVIPTGQPCLLIGRPGEVLFPSGDGQLYRCNIAEGSQGDIPSSTPSEAHEDIAERAARAVSWNCELPGAGQVYMNDAFWSPEKSVRPYVFVSLSTQKQVGKSLVQDAHKLWWLRMNDSYDEIDAVGPLTCPPADGSDVEGVVERFPTISVDCERKLRLVYIGRPAAQEPWGLYSVRLVIDPRTDEPCVPARRKAPRALAEGLAAEPLVISADGKRVFARALAGDLMTIELTDDN